MIALILFVTIETAMVPMSIYPNSYEGRVKCYADAAEMKNYLPQAQNVACKAVRVELVDLQNPLMQ